MRKVTVRKITVTRETLNTETSVISSSPVKLWNKQGNTPTFSDIDAQDNFINDNDSATEEEDIDINSLSESQEYIEARGNNSAAEIIVYSDTGSAIAKRLIPSLLVGTGTGLAMMPIFNYVVKDSKELGIDIHANESIFATSTANTFIVSSLSSFNLLYHFIKQKQQETTHKPDTCLILFAKIGAGSSIVLHLGLLWGIEFKNQQVAKSEGFDAFIAWATFTTVPLVINNTIETIKTINDLQNDKRELKLDSVGSKIMVYGLSALSIVGRSIGYTEAVKALFMITGTDETVSLGIGIAVGGILGATGIGLFEHHAAKVLFSHQEESLNAKKVIGGCAATGEGIWFSLPLLSLGLKATESWNPLLKGVLFAPSFVSNTIFGATKLYNNVSTAYDTVLNAFNNYRSESAKVTVIGEESDLIYHDG